MWLRRIWLVSFVFAGGVLTSASALDWKTLSQTYTTAPFQTDQEAVFAFKNNGNKSVTIHEIETSCGCVEAAADKKSYAPGESGVVVAKMAIGDRFGSYERFVMVSTDESPTPIRLEIKLEVPELAVLRPRSMTWRLNQPGVEKTVDLIPGAGLTIDFAKAETTSENFTVTLEIVKAGHLYRVHLKPKSTSQQANTAVRLYGTDQSGHTVLVSAYGNVQ